MHTRQTFVTFLRLKEIKQQEDTVKVVTRRKGVEYTSLKLSENKARA